MPVRRTLRRSSRVGNPFCDLPHEVGQEQRQREGARQPGPARAQPTPLRAQDERHRHRDAEKRRRMLVLEPEAEERAEDEPPPRVAGLDDADEHVAAPIQNTGSKAFMVNMPWTARNTGAAMTARPASACANAPPPSRHAISMASATSIAARDRREDTKCDERSAQGQRRARDEPDERRVVDVSEGEVPAAVEEVHLVAEIAVSVGQQEVEDELEAGQRRQQRTMQDGAVDPAPRRRWHARRSSHGYHTGACERPPWRARS